MNTFRNFLTCSALSAAFLCAEDPANFFYAGPTWQNLNSIWSNDTKQDGGMWGLVLGYDYVRHHFLYAGAEFDYASGSLDGSAGNDPTHEYFGEVRLGYDLACNKRSFNCIPFAGIGYYLFDQNIGGDSTFKSHFWYAPFGLRFDYLFNAHVKFGIHGSIGPMFAARWEITHSISERKADTWLLWKVEAPLSLSATFKEAAFDFSFIPYVREWAYRNDDLLIGQKNIYVGVKLAFGYHF